MKRLAGVLPQSLILILGIAVAHDSGAADGQVEINQLCVATGCFAGDSPGFPVQISNPGSYILTSNLEVPDNQIGIELNGSGITLDLGGHAILGPVECTGPGPSCAGFNSGPIYGISPSPALLTLGDTTIRNGTVSGFFVDCVRLAGFGGAFGILIQDLHVSNCGGDGIGIGGYATIESVTVRNAFGHGIESASVGTIVRDSVFYNNGEFGVNGANCSANIFADNGDATGVGEENCGNHIDDSICNGSVCP